MKNININEAIDYTDVVVTILSQSAYTALFRGKPVVMLGYIQLKDSGCTYEAFSKSKIEPQIKKALCCGFTAKQRQHFQEHVARLLKYYLWDDRTHEVLPFGQNIDEIEI